MKTVLQSGVQPVQIYPLGPKKYEVSIVGINKTLPIYNVEKDLAVVGNEEISFGCDVEFTQKIGKALANRLKSFSLESVLTVEVKPLPLVFEVCRNLGIPHFAVARKKVTPAMNNVLTEPVKSITTPEPQSLNLDLIGQRAISGKRIAIIDDVISTCGTLNALYKLAHKTGAEVKAVASVWLEGPWVFEKYPDQISSGSLISLGVLPLFADGEMFEELSKKAYLQNQLFAVKKEADA